VVVDIIIAEATIEVVVEAAVDQEVDVVDIIAINKTSQRKNLF
jgi:hypothetical protein